MGLLTEISLFTGGGEGVYGSILDLTFVENRAIMEPMNKKYQHICPLCGKVFYRRDADTSRYSAKYCSYSCNNKSRMILPPIACPMCGKIFKPIRKEQRTCSKTCGQKYKMLLHPPDPMVKIRARMAIFCCSMVARCLRGKTDRTRKLLGYTVEELRKSVERKFKKGMSWENYGNKVGQWSIDHIRPISSFPPDAPINEINALSNLQPLWHSDNCRKKNKWNE